MHVPYCSSLCVVLLCVGVSAQGMFRHCNNRAPTAWQYVALCNELSNLDLGEMFVELAGKNNSAVCLYWSFWSGNWARHRNVKVKLVEFHCTYTAAWNILKYELADLMHALYMSVTSSEFDWLKWKRSSWVQLVTWPEDVRAPPARVLGWCLCLFFFSPRSQMWMSSVIRKTWLSDPWLNWSSAA